MSAGHETHGLILDANDSFRRMPADGNRTTSFDREIPALFFAFDVLRSWGLPQLLALAHGEVTVVNPIDGDGAASRSRKPGGSCRAGFKSFPPPSPTRR